MICLDLFFIGSKINTVFKRIVELLLAQSYSRDCIYSTSI